MNKTAYQLLRAKYPETECVLVKEVADSNSRNRYLDFMVINLWESRGQSIIGFEVKSYRSDWLNELKNPAKQELHVPYCDFFYLLITDEKIAKVEEVPVNWGLMVVKGGKLHTLKKAPKLKPSPMPKSMMVSIIRRAADRGEFIHMDMVNQKVEEMVEQKVARKRVDGENSLRNYLEIKSKVEKFKELTGVDICERTYYVTIEKMADKFNFLLRNDFKDLLDSLKNINRIASSITKRSEEGINTLEEPNQS